MKQKKEEAEKENHEEKAGHVRAASVSTPAPGLWAGHQRTEMGMR